MEGALSSVPTTKAGTLTRENTKGYEHRAARKRQRTVISQQQLCKLEALYCREQWPKRSTKECLAQELGMSTTFVNIWFQNKRSRIRRAMKVERNQMTKKKLSFPIIRITPIAPKPKPVRKAGFYRNLKNATRQSSERVAPGKPYNWKASCEIGLQNIHPLPAIASRFKTKASRVFHHVEKLSTRDQAQCCKANSSKWKSSEHVGGFSSCTRSANRQEIVLGQTSCDPQTSHHGVQEVRKYPALSRPIIKIKIQILCHIKKIKKYNQ